MSRLIQVLGEKILGSYNRLSTISASNISSERHADTETVMVVTDRHSMIDKGTQEETHSVGKDIQGETNVQTNTTTVTV